MHALRVMTHVPNANQHGERRVEVEGERVREGERCVWEGEKVFENYDLSEGQCASNQKSKNAGDNKT